MYFAYINSHNEFVDVGVSMMLTDEYGSNNVQNIEVDKNLYDNVREFGTEYYIYQDGEIIENPDYASAVIIKERQRLDALTLTPADVERALYRAKGMDFDDLKNFIHEQLPYLDIKALSIEFRAKDFYRGAEANGMRLFDTIGFLLGYTPEDMDYLFENKELPSISDGENPDV